MLKSFVRNIFANETFLLKLIVQRIQCYFTEILIQLKYQLSVSHAILYPVPAYLIDLSNVAIFSGSAVRELNINRFYYNI